MREKKIRIANLSDDTHLIVSTIRQDAANVEPQALCSTQELQPGEASIFTVYSGSALFIREAPC